MIICLLHRSRSIIAGGACAFLACAMFFLLCCRQNVGTLTPDAALVHCVAEIDLGAPLGPEVSQLLPKVRISRGGLSVTSALDQIDGRVWAGKAVYAGEGADSGDARTRKVLVLLCQNMQIARQSEIKVISEATVFLSFERCSSVRVVDLAANCELSAPFAVGPGEHHLSIAWDVVPASAPSSQSCSSSSPHADRGGWDRADKRSQAVLQVEGGGGTRRSPPDRAD